MGRSTWVRTGASTLGGVVLALTSACGDGASEDRVSSAGDTSSSSAAGGPAPPVTTTADAAPPQHVLLERPGWQLHEAVDYRAGPGPLSDGEPELDWYAEYEGPRIDHDARSFTVPTARISGHAATLEALSAQLTGFAFVSEDVGGRQAVVAAPADRRPGIVIVALGAGYSVMALSYDDVVDLRHLAAGLAPVDEQQWVAAGGQVLDCVPFEPGCEPNG